MGYQYDFLEPLDCVLSSHFGKVALVLLLVVLWKELSMGLCRAKTRLEGKLAVVTGGNGGIGFETAKDLAARGARVIIGCRSRVRGEEAVRKIIASTGNKEVSMMDLDLSDLGTVRKFAQDFCAKEDKLDILVNNAGIGGFGLETRTQTKDNNEMIVQTNHLGHFLLTNLLKKQLAASGNARVVNVSSQANAFGKDMDASFFKDINSEKAYDHQVSGVSSFSLWKQLVTSGNGSEKAYDHQDVYKKSKTLNILFSNELARRWKSLGVSSFSLHPGFVRTEIFNIMPKWSYNFIMPLGYMIGKSTLQGAQTSLHCCLGPGLEKDSGTYWSECRKLSEENSGQGNSKITKKVWDSGLAEEVWEKSVTLVGLNE